METSIFKTSMQECESSIRNLNQNPLPKDMMLIGELVNLWFKNFNLLTIINKDIDYESKEN